jgi:hypothetical protein
MPRAEMLGWWKVVTRLRPVRCGMQARRLHMMIHRRVVRMGRRHVRRGWGSGVLNSWPRFVAGLRDGALIPLRSRIRTRRRDGVVGNSRTRAVTGA